MRSLYFTIEVKKYGIINTELGWFKSYLTERQQFVSIKNNPWVASGVQSTLLLSHNDINILTWLVNSEFRKVCEFFQINRMVLHLDKTNFILFSRTTHKDLELFCNNNNENQDLECHRSKIHRVTNDDNTPAVKFLGVFFILP